MIQTSSSIDEISNALAKVQAEVKDLKKDKQGYGYKYATLESLTSMARPILAKHQVSIINSHGFNPENNIFTVKTRAMCNGQWIEVSSSAILQQLKGMNTAQIAGAYVTYFRRYNLSSLLNITSDEDVDSDVEVPQAKRNTKAPVEKPLTLNEYLKRHGVKALKEFALTYGVKTKEDAEKLLADKAGLDELIKEFKSKNQAKLP